MSMVSEQNDFLLDVCKLIHFATNNGWKVSGGELYRTDEQQKIYFAQKKTLTMNSNHLRRLAIDINFFKNDKLTYDKDDLAGIGKYWESLNPKNRWGGNFKNLIDTPHFERNI